jgi:phosphoglycolate phosphatase/putative hydrolase of the HAD superfamily
MEERGKFKNIRAVIFDIDGTMYSQFKMRVFMIWEFLRYYLAHPGQALQIEILLMFRKRRELGNSAEDWEMEQYRFLADKFKVSETFVRHLVEKWMFKIPLKYLPRCRYPGLLEFVSMLKAKGIVTGVFSDYPAEEKLQALGVSVSLSVSADDKRINKLKPEPDGFLFLSKQLGILPKDCVIIGDRDDRDGEAARRAGMPFLLFSPGRPVSPGSFQNFFQLK